MDKHHAFAGTGVALVTPFKQGLPDMQALVKMIEYVLQGGVDYIVSLGSTGEAATLSEAEMQELVTFTVAQVNRRVPVVAGCFGFNDTARMLSWVDRFNFEGVSALLSASPAYVKPSQEGIFQHYQALNAASPVPIILYNVPGRPGSNLAPATIRRLAQNCSRIVAIKEASANFDQINALTKLVPTGFTVVSGDDPTALPSMALGMQGVISVIANAFPATFSTMTRLALQGNFAAALTKHRQVQDLHPWLYVEGNPVGIKAALHILDLCSAEVRLPLSPLSSENYRHLEAALRAAGKDDK